VHIVIDNEVYESTGGQPTLSNRIDFCKVAEGCRYPYTKTVENESELKEVLSEAKTGPILIVVKVKPTSRSDLGRPKTTPQENKQAFMKFLSK